MRDIINTVASRMKANATRMLNYRSTSYTDLYRRHGKGKLIKPYAKYLAKEQGLFKNNLNKIKLWMSYAELINNKDYIIFNYNKVFLESDYWTNIALKLNLSPKTFRRTDITPTFGKGSSYTEEIDNIIRYFTRWNTIIGYLYQDIILFSKLFFDKKIQNILENHFNFKIIINKNHDNIYVDMFIIQKEDYTYQKIPIGTYKIIVPFNYLSDNIFTSKCKKGEIDKVNCIVNSEYPCYHENRCYNIDYTYNIKSNFS